MSFSKEANVGPCSVQQRPACRSEVAAAPALVSVPSLDSPWAAVTMGGLQVQLSHGLHLPCAAAGLLQPTQAWQAGIPQCTAKLPSLEVGSWQGFGVSFGLVLVPVICHFMSGHLYKCSPCARTPGQHPLWKNWSGTMGRPVAFPPLGHPVTLHVGV